MSLPRDLLNQAAMLARHEPRRPRQASLRRAISAAYYALFHLLIDAATKASLGSHSHRRALRDAAARGYDHAVMAAASKGFAGTTLPQAVTRATGPLRIPPDLVTVARAFLDLQDARQDADYDRSRQFARVDVLGLVEQAEIAFQAWSRIRNDPVAPSSTSPSSAPWTGSSAAAEPSVDLPPRSGIIATITSRRSTVAGASNHPYRTAEAARRLLYSMRAA